MIESLIENYWYRSSQVSNVMPIEANSIRLNVIAPSAIARGGMNTDRAILVTRRTQSLARIRPIIADVKQQILVTRAAVFGLSKMAWKQISQLKRHQPKDQSHQLTIKGSDLWNTKNVNQGKISPQINKLIALQYSHHDSQQALSDMPIMRIISLIRDYFSVTIRQTVLKTSGR